MAAESGFLQPVGYEALRRQFGVDPRPHYRASYIARQGGRREELGGEQDDYYYPKSYAPEPTLAGQLEFALKYDGIDLALLKAVFERCDPGELEAWLRSKPTSKYGRRAWFLFEWLTGRLLDLPDANNAGYVDLLDPELYLCAAPRLSRRHRVRDNLLGTPAFCPMVRVSEVVSAERTAELRARAASVVADFDAALLQRAAQFLYLQETKSSFQIEREQPSQSRTLRFVELLRRAPRIESLDREALVELQNAIVDPRYAEAGYRADQNYIGQSLRSYEQVHYVCPRPEDVESLMQGLLDCHARCAESGLDAIAWAAVVAFGLVFVHPFEDGNGRLHRFLLHQVLSRAGFTPDGVIVPVSAAMLADLRSYDRCLESFSRPLMERVDYELARDGRMTASGNAAELYRYWDATGVVEYLHQVVEQAVERDLRTELSYLAAFDAAWRELREIVDLPDRRLELFIQLCLGNQGQLSATKRSRHFEELSHAELAAMEAVVTRVLIGADGPGGPTGS